MSNVSLQTHSLPALPQLLFACIKSSVVTSTTVDKFGMLHLVSMDW